MSISLPDQRALMAKQRAEREAWRPRPEQWTDLDALKVRAQDVTWEPRAGYFDGPYGRRGAL